MIRDDSKESLRSPIQIIWLEFGVELYLLKYCEDNVVEIILIFAIDRDKKKPKNLYNGYYYLLRITNFDGTFSVMAFIRMKWTKKLSKFLWYE